MFFKQLAAAVLLTIVPAVCLASTSLVPTTTLDAETSNNTSASASFSAQSNGNRGSGNISKTDVHSLLNSGTKTKVYAHLMLWFGKSNHMNVGYSSIDPAQVHRQITDMISRGIEGVMIDWYGPNSYEDQATQVVMAEAETHPGFTFAIMVDKGAIKWQSCSGCTPQQALINQLQYVEQKYFTSPAYMTQEGSPVVSNFDIDLFYNIDWNAVNAALSTHPRFIFQNSKGFTHPVSGGSYSWVKPTSSDYGMSYLSDFYSTGLSVPAEETVGATYKGFNDKYASWGSGRVMGQQCGQTWLKTFSKINSTYTSNDLPALQLVTWNDYEEGSEIESGIDNCFSVSAATSGNSLTWTPNGDEGTLDHYRIYLSSDGSNLTTLADMAPGLHSANLCSYSIPTGDYTLYVQAIGKPMMANQMSAPVAFTSSRCEGTSAAFTLGASPTVMAIPSGKSATLNVTVAPTSGKSINTPIALTCISPAGLTCKLSPSSVIPGRSSAKSTLTVSATTQSADNHSKRSVPFYASFLFVFGLPGIVLIDEKRRRRAIHGAAVVTLGILILLCASCGGGTSAVAANKAIGPHTYSITIDGSSGSTRSSTVVAVTVQ